MKLPRKKSERGNAILEFAIGFSLLWMLFAGVFQVGYTFYVYNVLMTAVANAAELGSKLTYDTGNTSAYTTELQNLVVYGTTSSGTTPLVPNLSTSNVNVAVNPSTGTPQDVTITITNYSINGFFTSYSLNNKPRATTLFFGNITCSTC